jgi:hypothetical protein
MDQITLGFSLAFAIIGRSASHTGVGIGAMTICDLCEGRMNGLRRSMRALLMGVRIDGGLDVR